MQQENETNHVEAETFHDHDQDFMTMIPLLLPPVVTGDISRWHTLTRCFLRMKCECYFAEFGIRLF